MLALALSDLDLKSVAAAVAARGVTVTVEYRGSIIEEWGPVTLVGPSPRGEGRFDLRTPSGAMLFGARPESFDL